MSTALTNATRPPVPVPACGHWTREEYPHNSVQNYLRALVLVAAFAGLSQAASVAPTTGSGASKPAVRTAPQHTLSDAQIERNIRARLAKSKMAATEHFTVTVHDGVAVLEGKSNVIQHKGVATRLAKLGGAIAVQNHIQISDEAKAKAAARLAKYRNAGNAAPQRATVVQASK